MKLYAYRGKMTKRFAEAHHDMQKMHELLCGIVGSSRAETNILFKYDPETLCLLVQSDVPPMPCDDLEPLGTFDLDNWFERITDGQMIHFSITFLPAVRDAATGKKKYYHTDKDKKRWLENRLSRAGLDMKAARLEGQSDARFNHEEGRGGKTHITLCTYDVYGVVTDKDAFRQIWNSGVGTGKSYGGGMMIAKAS